MAVPQAEKARRFQALHSAAEPFVIPNPWDAGTAKILASLGFKALTTTSAGLAFTLGRIDGTGAVSRAETLANARMVVEATNLPVAADLENGFGHSPQVVAETIRMACEAGLVGGSIEDATGDASRPIYDLQHAVERVAAASEAARAAPFPFLLVARADNFFHGREDLDDTLRRLQAYEKAGADVLYAPAISTAEHIRTVCSSVGRPVNVLMGGGGADLSVAQLGALGVRRISVGAAMTRAAFGAFVAAAREMKEHGTFRFADEAIPFGALAEMMPPLE